MQTILLQLDPRLLDHPDADLRYRIPDLLVERSSGLLRDDGYAYFGDVPLMDIFLTTTDVEKSLAYVLDLIDHTRILNNDLRPATVIAAERDGRFQLVFPAERAGTVLAQ